MEVKIESTTVRILDKNLGLGEMVIATKRKPFNIICTGNSYERYEKSAMNILREQGKAKCVKTWERNNYIDDPYGRLYKVGTIDCSIWDLRECFGITTPLEEFLDFETKEFLKGHMPFMG